MELNIHVSGLGGNGELCSPLLLPRELGLGLGQGRGDQGSLPPTLSTMAVGSVSGSPWGRFKAGKHVARAAMGKGPKPPVVTPMLLPLQLTMNDFSVHRIIGRGGFGEVYGCRKADTGKM